MGDAAEILIVTLPDGGHLNPSFSLAYKLASRGHTITFGNVRDVQQSIERAGFGFLPILEDGAPAHASTSFGQKLGAIRALREHAIQRLANDILRRPNAERPAVVLLDAVLQPAELILERAGIRTVVIHITLPPAWHRPLPKGQSRTWLGTLRDRLRSMVARAIYSLRERLLSPEARARIAAARSDGGPSTAHELVLCPRVFEWPEIVVPAHRRYGGACVLVNRVDEAPFPWEWLPASGPTIYVAFGTQASLHASRKRLLDAVVETARRRPAWHFVICADEHLDVPSNVLVVPRAPQTALLPHVDVMVTHGGINSVKECIVAGVPMVVTPFLWDQPDNGARIEYHGLGLMERPRRVTPRSLESMIERVLTDGGFKARVAAMREVFREDERREVEIEVVEALIDSAQGAPTPAA